MRKHITILILFCSCLIQAQNGLQVDISTTPYNYTLDGKLTINDITFAGGSIIYVSNTNGNDANSGDSRTEAFKTIGHAITSASVGDAIVVMEGTYTETGLDINKNSLYVFFEIGAIIDPASDTCLVISGSYCWVGCNNGALKINNNSAATVGVYVSGTFVYLSEIRISCGSIGDKGFVLVGNSADLRNCRCSSPLTSAFEIHGDMIKLEGCCTGGEISDGSIGFHMTNSCDKFRLRDCGSQGHSTAGYYVDSGCTNGCIDDSYSGGGDGKWRDIDNNTIFSNFQYDETIHTNVTFTATGGVGEAGKNYNLFQVIGAVRIYDLQGVVTTVLPNTASLPNIELYSANASVDVTDAAGAPNIAEAVVGAVLERVEPVTEPLVFGDPDNSPKVVENANYRDPKVPIVIIKDDAADTYVQLQLSAALASGAMRWYVKWEPVSEDGNLIQVNP